jgi:hypothetical protein
MLNILSIIFFTLLAALFTPALSAIFSEDFPFIDTIMPDTIPAEIIADWKMKDGVDTDYSAAIAEIKSALPAQYASYIDTGSTEALYIKACHWRRVARMQPFSKQIKKLLCTRHYNEGNIFSGYLEDLQPDTAVRGDGRKFITHSKGSRYKAGAALLLLSFDNYYPAATPLCEDTGGVIRDPCVSFDAQRVAFAWSKNNNGYHIYEMELSRPDSIRQLTFDAPTFTVSDYEPCYAPNGDIIFNSSRCFQGHGYFTNLVSNLYIMNKDGKFLRRICFDQAHDFNPTVTSNGKIMYSRWEFNDRSSHYAFGVFTMNPDGALQNEYFGNQLSYPGTFPNAREIPNSGGKLLSIAGEVASSVYQGDLVIINPTMGRNAYKDDAVRFIAPKRVFETSLIKNFQSPYPLNENWFLISHALVGESNSATFRLYLMDIDGNRELLAWDAYHSISQPFPLCERKAPRIACQTDYSKSTGEVRMSNAYYGMGIDSTVKPGTIKKIRVIALDYRIYPAIGNPTMSLYTPIARFGAAYDSKRILGEMKVEADGSAAFIVPAKTPLYVQLIDSGGCMIQSMRSWMTLQPGESFDCFGCHEDKNNSPQSNGFAIARTPKTLEPFGGSPDGYLHYSEVIQPILDAKCVSCHTAGHKSGLDLSGDKIGTGDLVKNGTPMAERFWCTSYLNISDTAKKLVNYPSLYSFAEGEKPNTKGSGKSPLIAKLRSHSGEMKDVSLTEKEMSAFCAWIDLSIPHGGKYTDDMTPLDSQFYEQRLSLRKREEALEAQNIREFIKNGGYNNSDYGGDFASIASDNHGTTQVRGGALKNSTFQVRFSHGSRRIILTLPSAGKVTLIDLKGRTVAQVRVSHEEFETNRGTARRALLVGVPAGLYIALFTGTQSTTVCKSLLLFCRDAFPFDR